MKSPSWWHDKAKNISCLSNSSAAQCKVIHIKFHVVGDKKNQRCNEEKVLGENYLRVGKLEKSRRQRENYHSLWGLILWFCWPLAMLCKNKFHFHWHTSTIDIKVDRGNSPHKLYSKELQKLLFEWKLVPTFMRLSKVSIFGVWFKAALLFLG